MPYIPMMTTQIKNTRQFPQLPDLGVEQREPISFVTIRFCDDYFHNILRSECVGQPVNELITVDNRGNLWFENLGQAINAGIAQALHDLIVVVHEDVLLPPHWDQHLMRCLDALKTDGHDWGLLGAVGWPDPSLATVPDPPIGHWSDPRGYVNTLGGRPYQEVHRLDEQLMVLRRSRGVRCDPELPSIHNIGRDLPLSLAQRGLKTFIINAPTIHKFSDHHGVPIIKIVDSDKITDRKSFAFRAERGLSDEYFRGKWMRTGAVETGSRPDPQLPQLDSPILLIGKGGAGSRLVSVLARDLGIPIGNEVNRAGDALEMVIPLYQGILRKFSGSTIKTRTGTAARIRQAAAEMLERAGAPAIWGFKLPESALLLPEIAAAFPKARYIHLLRAPLATCLRRTHMTARLDNQIGRVTLPAAYRHCGRPVEDILSDSPALHMACTTRHQLELIVDHLAGIPAKAQSEVRFERTIAEPATVLYELAQRLGLTPVDNAITRTVDPQRAETKESAYDCSTVRAIERILAPLQQKLDG